MKNLNVYNLADVEAALPSAIWESSSVSNEWDFWAMRGASQKAMEKGTGIKVQNDNDERNTNYIRSPTGLFFFLIHFFFFQSTWEYIISFSFHRNTGGGGRHLWVWIWKLLAGSCLQARCSGQCLLHRKLSDTDWFERWKKQRLHFTTRFLKLIVKCFNVKAKQVG